MEHQLGTTESALLAEIADMLAPSTDGVRVAEIAEALGISRSRVHILLHELRDQGRLELVPRMIIDLAGRRMPVTTYCLKDSPDAPTL